MPIAFALRPAAAVTLEAHSRRLDGYALEPPGLAIMLAKPEMGAASKIIGPNKSL